MTMDIDESHDRVWLSSVSHDIIAQLFYVIHCGVQLWIRCQELSIQIIARQRSSVVACYDPIWVSHRDHFENYTLPHAYGLRALPCDKLDKTLNDEA